MEIITEADLRSAKLPEGTREYRVGEGVFVTPEAREYLARRGIAVVVDENDKHDSLRPVMPTDLSARKGGPAYKDAVTGRGYAKKPEDMTHLRANLLVKKTHPRIALRGQLDELEAEIICLQVVTSRGGQDGLTKDLEDTLRYVREVLAAEVKETPLGHMTLFGLGEARLHEISHNVKGELGIPHPVPSCAFGEVAAGLNLLRTKARVTELAALHAFEGEKNKRDDIVMALNRLSSGFYVLFCRLLAEKGAGGDSNGPK